MERNEVYKLIDGERDYQNNKWPQGNAEAGWRHSKPEEWIVYMEDYLLEAKHILSREDRIVANPKAMAIVRKIAAMCVNAMEHIDTPPRQF
jgi:hypothetical protein